MIITKKTITSMIVITLLVGSVTGCSNWSKRDRHTALGAGIGAIGGNILTGGSTLGTFGGAAVGGVVRHQTH